MKRLMLIIVSFTVLALSDAFAQYVAKGTVSDEQGPMIGVSVLELGTTNGVETDIDGHYELTVSSENSVLVFMFIGYKDVQLPASQAQNVIMTVDAEMLEDVVVIGYGTVKKEDMTGSVSTVRADQINKGVVTSPADLMQGKSAGVVVTQGSGQPGSGSTIRIRGGSSLNASNDPLIVIDGLPISNSSISGVADPLASINPNDIESFTVLKDASATAIYGSRASNGVIIITTKKGQKGTSKIPHISFDFTTSISQNSKYLDVMTGDEMRAAIEAYAGKDSDAYLALGDENTDWQKAIYQLGQSYDANLSISGNAGFGKAGYMPYRVSGGYFNEKGTLKTSSMERGTLALNLTPTFFDDHLKIALNGKGMYMNNRFANQGAISQAVEYDPTQPIYDDSENGLDGYRIWGTNGVPNTQSTCNPIATLEQYKDIATAGRFIGNAQIDYKFHGLEALRFNLNLGLDYSSSEGTVDTPEGSEQSWHTQTEAGSGRHTEYSQMKKDETLEAYLAYDDTFGKHTVGAMAGYSWQHFYYESDDLTVKQNNWDEVIKGSETKSEYFLVSFFGRANYSYDNRYLLTATVRYDGTSRFANNKWGLFPSVAFAWNIKNESFLKNNKDLSTLKLRLSWGQTGQQDLQAGDYPSLPKYYTNLIGSYYYFGNTVIIPITPQGYNADLKWETTTTYNAGVDLGFLNDRITASVNGYYRLTTDLLNYTPVPAGSNLKNYLNANIGSLVNYGVELDMNFIALQTSDWFWQIGVNGAWNRNEITQLTANDSDDYRGVATGGISGGVGNTIQRFMVGYPVNSFYVYQQVYDQDGKPIVGAYVDRNGDGMINADDMYCYKKAAPDFTFGLNTTLSYKNWTLAISAHANIGNYVYDNNSSRLSLLTDLWTNNFVSNRIDSAMEDGFTTAQYFSDYYVKDASFFKLDNITLGYNFNLPHNMSLNLFGTVQNVCVITGYDGIDPEIFNGIDNNLWPRPRTYVLGVKFNF